MREYVAPFAQGNRYISLVPGNRQRLLTFDRMRDAYFIPAGLQMHIEEQTLVNDYVWRWLTNHPALMSINGQIPAHGANMVEAALLGEGRADHEYWLDVENISQTPAVMDFGFYLYGYYGSARADRPPEPCDFFLPPVDGSYWEIHNDFAGASTGMNLYTDMITYTVPYDCKYVRLYNITISGTVFAMNARIRIPELGLFTWTMATAAAGDRLIGPIHIPVCAKLYAGQTYRIQWFNQFPVTGHVMAHGWRVP